ncbi:hypothetical protein [Halosimplex sp. J119]
MGIKSGTLTEFTQEFYTEAIFRQDKLRSKFQNTCDSLITDGDPPSRPLYIDKIGEFTGGWNFWNQLYNHEKEHNFHFQPEFCVPSGGAHLPSWVINSYNLADYKISPRILFYPFGYFVVRVRVYFEFENEVPVREFLNFERSVQKELEISIENGDRDIQSIFMDINKSVFAGDIPEPYVGKNGDRKVCSITYLYESDELSKSERARIIRREERDIPERTANEVAEPYMGYLKGDRISVDLEGAAVVTPSFSPLSERNRRWKRIHLLNNLYLAYDFALLEERHLKRIRDDLTELLDEFNTENWFGNPISPRYLGILQAVLEFGAHLRVTRGEVYGELEPLEMKENVQPDIDDYVDRVINHESVLGGLSDLIPQVILRRII